MYPATSYGTNNDIIIVIIIVWYLFQVIASWKIFSKFGESGWKAIIPIYNSYVWYKAIWNVKIFWVDVTLSALTVINIAGANANISAMYVTLLLITLIGLMVLKIMQDYNLSKAFGQDFNFMMGLIFFEPIFKLILAFGSSEYVGNSKRI